MTIINKVKKDFPDFTSISVLRNGKWTKIDSSSSKDWEKEETHYLTSSGEYLGQDGENPVVSVMVTEGRMCYAGSGTIPANPFDGDHSKSGLQ